MSTLSAHDEKRIEDAIEWVDSHITTSVTTDDVVRFWKSLYDRFSTGPTCRGIRKRAMVKLLRKGYSSGMSEKQLRAEALNVFYVDLESYLARESDP